jgi:hypothetical protein
MTHFFSNDDILALAPDDSSLKAAKGLQNLSTWTNLGQNDVAIWGECKGSGSKPYLTQMQVAERAFKCTCPSRKFPCKHALAIALIYTDDPAKFHHVDSPAWVTEWLNSRLARAEKKATKDKFDAAVELGPDELERKATKQLKQQAQKQLRLQDGLDELQLWLVDLIKNGFANLAQQRKQIKQVAARMVDAQLQGMARRLNQIEAIAGLGNEADLSILRSLGQMQLLIQAYKNLPHFSPAQQTDILEALGANKDTSLGGTVQDDWLVLGVILTDDGKLLQRTVWLQGQQTQSFAMLLDYQYGTRNFEPWLMTGQVVQGEVAYFFSNQPLRGKLAINHHVTTTRHVAYALDDVLSQNAKQLAANPWQLKQPWFLRAARVKVDQDEHFSLVIDDRVMPLNISRVEGWQLLAILGVEAADVFAEFDQTMLTPLSAWQHGQLIWVNRALL